jgi:phage terminase Nu1 subunit (DNA packaging protein)
VRTTAPSTMNILLDIKADSAYDLEIVYFRPLSSLSDGAPVNETLSNSPDIYLFGTLKEAELYLEHDERNPVWAQKYRQAVSDENIARERAELGAAPASVKLPTVFG